MRCKFFSVLLAVGMILVVSGDLQAENKDTIGIKIGGIVHPYGSAFLARAEYEHAFTGFVSIVPSLNYLSYDYEDDGYTEEGRGPGLGCTVRFYPGEAYQKGFWLGPGVTIFNIDWEWDEYYWNDSSSFIGVAPALELGWKIELSDRVLFDPNVAIGYHTSFTTDDDDYEPQATTFFATLSIGISFGIGSN